MDLITRSDDERLEIISKEWFNTLKHNDPLTRDVAKVVCFFIDSLRDALEREQLCKKVALQEIESVAKERDAALSRIKQLEEAVEWACSQEIEFAFYDVKDGEVFLAELRRRAGKEEV